MNNEDELQRAIESGTADGGVDSKAYEIVFNGLKREPASQLPDDFADHIVSLIEANRRTSFTWWEKLLFISASFFMLALFIAVIILTGFSLELGFLKAIAHYGGVFVFAAILLLMLNYLDFRLVRRKLQA